VTARGSFSRATNVARLGETSFDVVVIGGGITGAGVALDAASRGLRTALIERGDFASGTSSKSSKLVHGGLRYLQQGDVKLVYQALAERHRLLHNAPHLVEKLAFVMPIFTKGGIIPRKLARTLGGAMWAYDLTGGLRIGKRHERLTTAETLERMPFLDPARIAGAYLYYDARADDARLTLTIARTAALDFGAVVVNHAEVVGLMQESGRVCGAVVDIEGESHEVKAKVVVNATGVWADEVRALSEGTNPDTIRPAKGIHVTVARHLLPCTDAGILPVRGDRRSVFVVPEGDVTYIGTTDTDYEGSIDSPHCTSADVDYLLDAVNAATDLTLTTDDVLGTWAGLRPLVKSATSGRTADLSRSHAIHHNEAGLITITGGKLTTYREMAADTVDEVVQALGDELRPTVHKRCRTKALKLRGAEPISPAALGNVSASAGEHLISRYGAEAAVLDAMVATDPSLGEPLLPGLAYLRVEVPYAARYEMARTVDDVLSRRTRALLFDRNASADGAVEVASLMADELRWTPSEEAEQVAHFRSVIAAELVAEGRVEGRGVEKGAT
jgi:glycerol-3-phosphate dehydrogenase